jgi:glycosyltransferase involved in cell wall biosynthesis
MKVSIITATYNSASTIKDTMDSVQTQDYPDIEHIIVDGKSTDDTLKILSSYEAHISNMISESDQGIYDAMNKGIAMATGDIVAILNSDDFYEHTSVISEVVKVFESSPVDAVYGDLLYVDAQDTSLVKRYWKSGNYYRKAFLNGWMPPHPSFFVKRDCYTRFGNFDTSFKSAADYELMLRLLYKNHCTAAYLNTVLVRMREGGKSNENILNRLLAHQEDRKAWTKNGLSPSFYTLRLKPLRKIGQYFKRP